MTDDYYSVDEASKLMNKSPQMLDIYVKKGFLTKYKQLGKTLFLKSEVDKLLIPKPLSKSQS